MQKMIHPKDLEPKMLAKRKFLRRQAAQSNTPAAREKSAQKRNRKERAARDNEIERQRQEAWKATRMREAEIIAERSYKTMTVESAPAVAADGQ